MIPFCSVDPTRGPAALDEARRLIAAGARGFKLHPPLQTAQWSFLNAAPFPIKFTRRRILVEAKVNGVQGLFILDSGAQNIVLSGTFARRAGLRAVGHGDAQTARGGRLGGVRTR